MYKKILLASDCSKESLVALREGALIAQSLRATAHLLIIDPGNHTALVAQAGCTHDFKSYGHDLLELGLDRLRRLGVNASGELLQGDPVGLIASRVRSLTIDLIVLGHRRQSFVERWWSGSRGLYIVDDVPCSVLIARDTISDGEFEQRMNAAHQGI